MKCVQVKKDRWSHLADRIAPVAVEETDTHWRVPLRVWRDIEAGRTAEQPAAKPSPLPGPLPTEGPGTELKRLLEWFGINAGPHCACNRYALKMNRGGPDWCRNHMDLIVGWLRAEAKRRGLPFSGMLASRIVARAINRAERRASRDGVDAG